MQRDYLAEGTPEARPQLVLGGHPKKGVRGVARRRLPHARRRTGGAGQPDEAPSLKQPRGPDREVRPPNLTAPVTFPRSSSIRSGAANRGDAALDAATARGSSNQGGAAAGSGAEAGDNSSRRSASPHRKR